MTTYEDSADNDALGTALHGQIRVYVELQVNVSVVLKYPVHFETNWIDTGRST